MQKFTVSMKYIPRLLKKKTVEVYLQQETSQAYEYDLRTEPAKDLYKNIISQAGYKDNNKGDNLKLNRNLIYYIQMNHRIYNPLLKDSAKTLEFFKTVFNSLFFFKTFLIKEATQQILNVGESMNIDEDILKVVYLAVTRRQPESNQLAITAKDLYNGILLQNGYKDNRNGENFKLNESLMEYIKMKHHIYELLWRNVNLLNNDAPRLDFFKKVFESFFFSKKSLIKIHQ